MARLLGYDAHLVSYGAMAKQPLSLPTSLFIFKNLTCHGFWQNRWYNVKPREDRDKLMQELVNLIKEKKVRTSTPVCSLFHYLTMLLKLDAPEHEVLTLSKTESDEEASENIRDIIKALSQGRYGKKVLLKIESKDLEFPASSQ